jgi:uncharacterized protein (DUF58 family)
MDQTRPGTAPRPDREHPPLRPDDSDALRVVGRRYHFNLGGIIYVITTVLLMTGAINSQNNLLFFAFGLALSGLFISGVISGAAMMGLRVWRLPVAPARVGETLTIRYRVHNRNRFIPAMGLTIEELRAGEGRWGLSSWGRRPRPDWSRFITRPIALIVEVGPRSTEEASVQVRACRRGEVVLDRVRVRSSFPFGLMAKSVILAREQALMVHPAHVPLEDRFIDSLLQGPRGSAGYAARARAPGIDEFTGLRQYVPGDPTSRIAWKPSARSLASGGSLVVRRHAAAGATRLWVVLALADRDADDDDRELAIALAAAIITQSARREATRQAHIGLCVPALGVTAPPRPRRLFADFLLDDLARLDLASIDPARPVLLPPRVGTGNDALVVVHAGSPASIGGVPARHVDLSRLGGVVSGTPPPLRIEPAHARGGHGP